jgi:hypothetical protein
MARVKVHALCLRPLSECACPDDDETSADEDISAGRMQTYGSAEALLAALEDDGSEAA